MSVHNLLRASERDRWLLHVIGMEDPERDAVTIVQFFEFGDETTEAFREFVADATDFGRRIGIFRAGQNHRLQLEQCIIDLIIAQMRDLCRGITRGSNKCFPDTFLHAIAIGAIKSINLPDPGGHRRLWR